jgi:hypothetical protein
MNLIYCTICRWIYATGDATLEAAAFQHLKTPEGVDVDHTANALLEMADIAWDPEDPTLTADAQRMRDELDARVPP